MESTPVPATHHRQHTEDLLCFLTLKLLRSSNEPDKHGLIIKRTTSRRAPVDLGAQCLESLGGVASQVLMDDVLGQAAVELSQFDERL